MLQRGLLGDFKRNRGFCLVVVKGRLCVKGIYMRNVQILGLLQPKSLTVHGSLYCKSQTKVRANTHRLKVHGCTLFLTWETTALGLYFTAQQYSCPVWGMPIQLSISVEFLFRKYDLSLKAERLFL